jgi:hypothetical protein
MNQQYFTMKYAISPLDGGKTQWAGSGEPVTVDNFSFAMLDIDTPEDGPRRVEWAHTINTDAAVVCTASTNGQVANAQSIHTAAGSGQWIGNVGWNDGHVNWETSPILRTRYGPVDNPTDHLFVAGGEIAGADALMEYE